MIRLFVRHSVTDFATWKQAYDAFDAQRPGMGVIRQAAYQAADNPNDVTVTHDFDTLEAAQAFMASPSLKEAMEAAGVAGEPDVWFARPA